MCDVVGSRAASELLGGDKRQLPGVRVGRETLLIDGGKAGGEQIGVEKKSRTVAEGNSCGRIEWNSRRSWHLSSVVIGDNSCRR